MAGSSRFGQAAARCYSNRRILLSAERMKLRMGKGDTFRKQRREFELVKREVEGLKAGMGTAKGWAGYTGMEDSPHPYSVCIPFIPFSGQSEGLARVPLLPGRGRAGRP